MTEQNDLNDIIKKSTRTHADRRRKRHRRRWWQKIKPIYFTYLFVPIIVGVVILSVLAVDSLSEISQSQNEFSTVFDVISDKPATELSLTDYDQVDHALDSLNKALNRADTRTKPLQLLSFLNADWSAQFELLSAAQHITTASRHFLAGLKPTIVHLERGGVVAGGQTTSETVDTSGDRTVELLRAGRNRFVLAQAEIEAAKKSLNNLELDGVSGDVLVDHETLKDYIDQIETYNSLAIEAPELLEIALGLDETQTYLIYAQNNDEMRPSGGYASTWGWFQIRSGHIQDYDYFPATDTSPVPPDESLGSELNIPSWWIQYTNPVFAAWDGSWHADFPSTAELATWYYNNGDNLYTPLDGVIGIDLTAFEYLLAALREVYVPEYDRVVTAETFRDELYALRAEREEDGDPLEHKHFGAALYRQIMADWQVADGETKGAINRALLQAIRERHLLLYFVDEELQNAVDSLDWAGDQNINPNQDYIMVNDTNLGNKSSSSIRHQITYDVTINPDETLTSSLAVLYDFSATVAEQDPAVQPIHYENLKDYYNLLQVFVPAGTQMVSSENVDDVTVIEEEQYTDFVGQMFVLYNSTKRVRYEYTIPDAIENLGAYKRYILQVDKQSGQQEDGIAITVSLPNGAEVISVTPEPSAQYALGQPVLEFNFSLLQDETIEIIYTD